MSRQHNTRGHGGSIIFFLAAALAPLGCADSMSDTQQTMSTDSAASPEDSSSACQDVYTMVSGTASYGSEEGVAIEGAAGVQVEADPNWGSEATQSIQTLSDKQGHFQLPLSEGGWRVTATDAYGCQTSEAVSLEILPCEEQSIELILDLCLIQGP